VFTLWIPTREERYLIVELSPRGERGLLFGVNRDKYLLFRKAWDNFSLATFAKSKNFLKKKLNVIVVTDESAAYVVKIPVELKQRSSKNPLTAGELENLLGQTVSRVFIQHRESAGRALGVNEVDTVLIGSRVFNFKIDGHHVVNPIGFAPKILTAAIELTFTSRNFFVRLKPLFERHKEFFFTESSRAELFALSKVQAAPFALLSLEAETSPFFILTPVAVGHHILRGNIGWSADCFLDFLKGAWAVEEDVAERIYGRYLDRRIGEGAGRSLLKLFRQGAGALLGAIKKSRLKGTVFLKSSRELPFPLSGRRGAVVFHEPPLHTILHTMGFHVEFENWPLLSRGLFSRLAPFIEFYASNDDLEINHWLRRRLHWLGATVSNQKSHDTMMSG